MIRQEFPVTGSPEVEVRIGSGRVELLHGEPGLIRVTVDTRDDDFVVEQRGGLVYASSGRTASWLGRNSSFVTVEMPDEGEGRVSTASARVEVEAPMDKVDVKTASGEVAIRRARTASVKTASGDVELGHVSRSLKVSTASGDVFLRGDAEGNVELNTASGDIHIEQCAASLDVNTVSGNSFIRRFRGSQASFKSMSGSVEIGIPAGTEVDLDANILSGGLRTPPRREESTPIERRMSVKVKLVSGDLRIDRV